MFCLNKRNIRVAISPTCNLNCVYCDHSKNRKPERPGAMEDFRHKSLAQGVISTDMLLKIIKVLYLAGFEGITLTGGEPFLNPEWDLIVNKAKEIGIPRVNLTTNGMLLNSYLKKKKHLPKGLTLLTISLDTTDPVRFKTITRGGDLTTVMKGLRAAKKDKPELRIKANKVLMKTDMRFLLDYIKFCEKSGVIDDINLLNLILKEPKDEKQKRFFEKEFISASEVVNFFSTHTKYNFAMDSKYEYQTKLSSGLRIIIKDTDLTMRASQCNKCPIYCQEGFYTVRVATDGTLTRCIDYKMELPFIDSLLELNQESLVSKVNKMVQVFQEVKLERTLKSFFDKYNIESR